MHFVKRLYLPLIFVGFIVLVTACKDEKKTAPTPQETTKPVNVVGISQSDFGTLPTGEKVERYSLKNDAGMQVDIITYGGIITSLTAPDKNGKMENVVLNFSGLEDYLAPNPFFGALVGRYGNRIANAKFTLDGVDYTLAANNGPNNLHGGLVGFDKVVWKVIETHEGSEASLKLAYTSKDMEEGFPGNLAALVTYTLTADNALIVAYEATTDKKTVVNLTQHAYFNLSGDFSTSILDHELTLNADKMLPVDATLIPTGDLVAVAGSPFDFLTPKPIGQDIDANDAQLKIGGGYDHCWALNGSETGMRSAVKLVHPKSGRVMEVSTTEPGIQFYTGNFLDGTLPNPQGGTYAKRSGLCLETQHYPDSPNQAHFPSVVLAPGEKYETMTTFSFSTL